MPAIRKRGQNRYASIIEKLFLDRHRPRRSELTFSKTDIKAAGEALGIPLPENIADIIYSHRYRAAMPPTIVRTQPEGREWVIVGRGKSQYAFVLVAIGRISPNPNLISIKIPDATPEIISVHAQSDEQALLAKVRYNRLVDIFLGLASYSLQNHLRTSVKGIGQVEIDELYVGIDRRGRQFIIPVQAKRGSDKLGSVQIKQDVGYCEQKFPLLICRPIAAQLVASGLIAMFELAVDNDELRIVEERHYKLVPGDEIGAEDLKKYAQ